jgi:hypothetical protein
MNVVDTGELRFIDDHTWRTTLEANQNDFRSDITRPRSGSM